MELDELSKQLLEYDLIQIHRIVGITMFNHSLAKSARILQDDIPLVLTKLSVLEALGKFRCIRGTSLDTVLEKV